MHLDSVSRLWVCLSVYLFLHLRPPYWIPFPPVSLSHPSPTSHPPALPAVSGYSQKLQQQLGRDSKFILCYAQKEELLLEQMYTDTVVELVNFSNESLGSLDSLACLLDASTGVLNEQGEIIFVFGDAGMGKSMLLQRLQSLWAAGQLV